MKPSDNLRRLAWRCRRGTKELDVLMMGFLHGRYPSASARLQRAFERLLELPDPELYALLIGREQSTDRDIADVIESILAQPDHPP